MRGEKWQNFLAYIKDNIFGVLPDYESPATPAQAKGFFINGKLVELGMPRTVAHSQIFKVVKKVGDKPLLGQALIELKGIFSPKEVDDAIRGTFSGRFQTSRRLTAGILAAAETLENPKP